MYNIRMDNDYVVYFHINKQTGAVFYVGIGNEKRAYNFYKGGRSLFWRNYVKKHGEPFVSIISNGLVFEKAAIIEAMYVKKYGRKGIDKNGILVNRSEGGEKTAKGFKHTNVSLKKIAEASRKKIWTEESRLKLSKSKTGVKQSESHRLNNSLAKSGKNHPFYGRKIPDSLRNKLIQCNIDRAGTKTAKSRQVINVITKEIYGSALYVAKTFIPNIHPHGFHGLLNGKTTNWTNYQYLDDYNNGVPKYVCTNTITKPKKVKSLATGEIYSSLSDAGVKNSLSVGTISLHVNNKTLNKKFELV